jgi:hypothetical protein
LTYINVTTAVRSLIALALNSGRDNSNDSFIPGAIDSGSSLFGELARQRRGLFKPGAQVTRAAEVGSPNWHRDGQVALPPTSCQFLRGAIPEHRSTIVVGRSLKHARESRMPSFGGLLLVTEIAGSRGAPMTNVMVYSFKGYDTAKHRYILRPAKATLDRIRRIDDALAVAGSGEELPRSMVDGDGFRRPGTQ